VLVGFSSSHRRKLAAPRFPALLDGGCRDHKSCQRIGPPPSLKRSWPQGALPRMRGRTRSRR